MPSFRLIRHALPGKQLMPWCCYFFAMILRLCHAGRTSTMRGIILLGTDGRPHEMDTINGGRCDFPSGAGLSWCFCMPVSERCTLSLFFADLLLMHALSRKAHAASIECKFSVLMELTYSVLTCTALCSTCSHYISAYGRDGAGMSNNMIKVSKHGRRPARDGRCVSSTLFKKFKLINSFALSGVLTSGYVTCVCYVQTIPRPVCFFAPLRG